MAKITPENIADLKALFQDNEKALGSNFSQLIDFFNDNKVTDNGDGTFSVGNTIINVNDIVQEAEVRSIISSQLKASPDLATKSDVTTAVSAATANKQDKIGYTPADDSKVVHDNHDGTITVNGKAYIPSDYKELNDLIKSLYNDKMEIGSNSISLPNIIKDRKPLNEKLGIHAWSYAFQQDNFNNNGIGFKIIKDHGFKYVRMGISWQNTEKSKSVYQLDDTQRLLNLAIENGLVPIVLISPDVPDIYSNNSYNDNFPLFLNFYKSVIQKFKGNGIYWEGLNEPNGSVSWFKSQSDTDDFQTKLASLSHNMALIVKSIDPSSPFLSGAIASNIWKSGTNPWQVFIQKAMTNKIDLYSDYISQHPYILNKATSFYYGTDSQIIYINNVLKNYNSSSKQAITELGFTSTDSSVPLNETDKAIKLCQSIFIADQLNVDIISLFSWNELPSNDMYGQQNPSEVGYGIISSDLRTDLEAGASISNILHEMNGFTYDFKEITNNNDIVLHYVNYVTHKHKIVYWSFDGDFHTNSSKNTTSSLPGSTIMAPKPNIYSLD